MKKFVKVASVLIAPVMLFCALLSGCKKGKSVEVDNGGIMQDIDVAPTQTAAYEQYSREAVEEYKAVARSHTDADGEVDFENADVSEAACKAAAKLVAYGCYNERTLDKYAYFSNQDGETDLGSNGYAAAKRQEFYLRVNESGNTCGYRYHYTIKKVIESGGVISGFKSLFESARTRITDRTNLLYRLEGDKIKVSDKEHNTLGVNLLECNWKTGGDWGKPDIEMKKSGFIEPENIEADIIENAGRDNVTVRGNVNILADNAIKKSMITETEDGTLLVVMTLDTDVLNDDEASMKMLRKGNDSDNCVWKKGEDGDDTGLTIVYGLWGNGLFRFYTVSETWSGTIKGFSGTVDSMTQYYYSYSDRDTDMTEYLNALESAKKSR